MNLGDAGEVLLGLAAVIAALSAAYVSVTNTHRLKQVHRIAWQIDRAVNGKPPGASPMVSQVQRLYDQIPKPIEKEEVNGAAMLPLLRDVAITLQRLASDVSDLKGKPPP